MNFLINISIYNESSIQITRSFILSKKMHLTHKELKMTHYKQVYIEKIFIKY